MEFWGLLGGMNGSLASTGIVTATFIRVWASSSLSTGCMYTSSGQNSMSPVSWSQNKKRVEMGWIELNLIDVNLSEG